MSRRQVAADRERLTFAGERLAAMTAEQRAAVTPERLTASFGLSHADAEQLLKTWR